MPRASHPLVSILTGRAARDHETASSLIRKALQQYLKAA